MWGSEWVGNDLWGWGMGKGFGMTMDKGSG